MWMLWLSGISLLLVIRPEQTGTTRARILAQAPILCWLSYVLPWLLLRVHCRTCASRTHVRGGSRFAVLFQLGVWCDGILSFLPFGLVFPDRPAGEDYLLGWPKAIIRICLAILFPKCVNAWVFEENLHASIPGFPN